jgi:hypothetical protein
MMRYIIFLVVLHLREVFATLFNVMVTVSLNSK